MNENIILDVRHLRKGYKKYPVLRDVSFQIKQGAYPWLDWKERCRENNVDEVHSWIEYQLSGRNHLSRKEDETFR